MFAVIAYVDRDHSGKIQSRHLRLDVATRRADGFNADNKWWSDRYGKPAIVEVRDAAGATVHTNERK